jgi:hypothetical protein
LAKNFAKYIIVIRGFRSIFLPLPALKGSAFKILLNRGMKNKKVDERLKPLKGGQGGK